jgi:hypothetical protein
MKSELEIGPVSEREPTADDLAGMKWWNDMTEAERAKALADAGWNSGALGRRARRMPGRTIKKMSRPLRSQP